MSKYHYQSGKTGTNNHKSLTSIALGALALLAVGSAHAYLTFSGIDNNGNLAVQVAPTNSSAARTSFLNNLTGVGTENFEAQSGSAPLVLNFGAAGNATLSGGGVVATNPAGGTNGAGRYSVPGGTRYWETSAGGAGNFAVDFSVQEAAFGFFGIDLGDFGGTLTLQLLNGATQVGSLVVPQAALAVADGSILYFGLIAQNAGEQFNHINFLTTVGTGDVFAFDSFTIGTQEQVTGTPEPATLALIAAAMLGLGLSRRRRS